MNSTFCFSTGSVLGVVIGIAVGCSSKPTPPDALTDLNLVTSFDVTTVPMTKNVIVGDDRELASSAQLFDKAREAALRNEPSTVRTLLESKVRSGHGTPAEANLVRQACKSMGDRVCSADIKHKYTKT